MSSIASVPTHSTAAWSQLEIKHMQNTQTPEDRSQRQQQKVGTDSRLTQPDSTQPPQSSSVPVNHNLPFSAVPNHEGEFVPHLETDTFPFDDYLTPDYSSDDHHTHTTPAIEDLVWQETYNDPVASSYEHFNDPIVVDTNVDVEHTLTSADSSDTKISSQHLPSPQLTATPTPPDLASHSQQSSLSSVNFLQSPVAQMGVMGPLASLDTRISHQMPHDHRPSSARGVASQTVSPVIRVSSHTRGDSPARDNFGVSRTLSKRSNASNLSSQARQSPRDSNQAAMLRPPQQQEDDWEDEATERAGVAPNERGSGYVPSVNDMARSQENDDAMADVEHWLANTDINDSLPADTADGPPRNRLRKDRWRSRSTGARTDAMGLPVFSDRHLPGPGAVIDVESNYYYSDEESEEDGDGNSEHRAPTSTAALPPVQPPTIPTELPPVRFLDEDVAPDEIVPLPRQFLTRGPWQDPVRGEPVSDSRMQPDTSNAAIMFYEMRAKEFDGASRAATWGTRRRLSDSEVGSIREGPKQRHQSLTQRTRDRGASFIHTIHEARNRAQKLIPRRSNSNIKQQASQAAGQPERRASPEFGEKRASIDTTKPSPRRPSLNKQKSPSTSSALLAMTSHLAAVGASGSGVNLEPEPPKSPLLKALKRVRSRSDVPKSPHMTGPITTEPLGQRIVSSVQTTASPTQEKGFPDSAVYTPVLTQDTSAHDPGVRMDLSVRESNIIPSVEGFKTHARQLNPRLAPFLIERIGQDQLRRYKRLVKAKVDHKRAVAVDQHCPSGEQCLALGGEVKVLPPRASAKDPSGNSAQFKVSNVGDSDVDESTFDGIVTPALFPDGIPLPPTKRLPAEFECPLCFQVRSFQKPSDWTKHVHEDVQPFSCTFPNCTEPKSFKRKADWVRHENERHRHLEWWQCNLHECTHVCYRKDNFVQHLVREHKKSEPKVRSRNSVSSKAKGKATAANASTREELEFWRLVDECRHESANDPRQEPCKFCDNVCTSWKKLSVHVGKHMEQIAMPVLQIVQTAAVTKDTVISPIELTPSRTPVPFSTEPGLMTDLNPLSPYPVSAPSNYQSSSAGQSPAVVQANMQGMGLNMNTTYYNIGMMGGGVQSTPVSASPYSAGPSFSSNPGYDLYGNYPDLPRQYPGYGTHTATYPPAQMPQGVQQQQRGQHHKSIPRSQPVDTNYSMPMQTLPAHYHNNQQFYSSPELEQAYAQPYNNGTNNNNMMPGNGMMTTERPTHLGPRDTSMGGSHMPNEYGYPGQSDTSQQGFFS